MSALTDLFTSMANKIRSKVGGVQTYTPLQMVSAIDDVYDAGAASVPTPTNITPSNASPVTLTANTAVKPTSGGLAIQSLIDITPDSAGQPLSNGGIYKMLGSAYVYDSQQTGGTKVASGDRVQFGAVSGSTTSFRVPTGTYISGEYDVSNVSSVSLFYVANAAAIATCVMGYRLDGVETSVQYGTTYRTLTVDLTNVSKFDVYGIIGTGSGARSMAGLATFS